MKLKEALASLDGDTLLRSHLDGKEHTAREWIDMVKDEDGAIVGESKSNYGKTTRKTIYFANAGILFSEIPWTGEHRLLRVGIGRVTK